MGGLRCSAARYRQCTSEPLAGVFHSLVVPVLLRALETAQRGLLSLHCACLDPLQTASLQRHQSSPPLPGKLAEPKAAQGYVTDYMRERKRKEKEEKEQAGKPANLITLTEMPVRPTSAEPS